MPVARSAGFDIRNTRDLSIIRSEPPPTIGDKTTWSLSGAAVGFISWLLALDIPFLLYGSNTLFFFLYTWPFFLVLMPVTVVVDIALHSLLNSRLLYSASVTVLAVGLIFALLFFWLLGQPTSGMNQIWVSAAKIWYNPHVTRHRPRAPVAYPGEFQDDDAIFQGAGWVN